MQRRYFSYKLVYLDNVTLDMGQVGESWWTWGRWGLGMNMSQDSQLWWPSPEQTLGMWIEARRCETASCEGSRQNRRGNCCLGQSRTGWTGPQMWEGPPDGTCGRISILLMHNKGLWPFNTSTIFKKFILVKFRKYKHLYLHKKFRYIPIKYIVKFLFPEKKPIVSAMQFLELNPKFLLIYKSYSILYVY